MPSESDFVDSAIPPAIPPKGKVATLITVDDVHHGVDLMINLRTLVPVCWHLILVHSLVVLRDMALDHDLDFDEASGEAATIKDQEVEQ